MIETEIAEVEPVEAGVAEEPELATYDDKAAYLAVVRERAAAARAAGTEVTGPRLLRAGRVRRQAEMTWAGLSVPRRGGRFGGVSTVPVLADTPCDGQDPLHGPFVTYGWAELVQQEFLAAFSAATPQQGVAS
ncbi:hypothetical protein [Saccharopolyspora cebuensis]|uniref:hypothetical protein n=1 Tax=Saccharopolyspora cebuensis TaxID=418759 RepID=UPI0031EB524F